MNSVNKNPYATPISSLEIAHEENTDTVYGGFWIRALATTIDSIWLYGIIYGVLIFVIKDYGNFSPTQIFFEYAIPFLVVMAFWKFKSSTPGKMIFGMRIVDSRTLGPVSSGRLVLRYLAYIISMIPIGLGFLWAAFDTKKQCWHDKIAGTVVIRDQKA